jgi:uncharacterized protein YqeY
MADSLKNTITEAMKDAMRAKDKDRLGAIRLIQSEIKRIEVDERIDVDDARVLQVLDKMCKQRRDAIEQFRSGGRDDLVAKETAELAVIQSFMPQPLSDAEIDALIDAAIAEAGVTGMAAMGKVMATLKPQIQGRADASAVSARVKARLAG